MKKVIIFLGFILAVLNNKKSNATDRIQYSYPDAADLATEINNSMTWTFSSKVQRSSNILTADNPVTNSEKTNNPWINPDTGYEMWKDANGNITNESCNNFCNNSRRDPDSLQNDEKVSCNYGCHWEEDGLVYSDDMSPNNTLYSEVSNNTCYCNWMCFTADMPIILADGSIKRADRMQYIDELLVWNFDDGHFDKANPLWIKVPQKATEYNLLKFSDGSILKTISQHRIFNREAGRFTYPMTEETPLGTHTLNAKGEWVKLIEKHVKKEDVIYYNIITARHINCFVGNILTSCRLNNIYPIKNLKFIKDERKFVPYTAYSSLDKKWYDGLRLAEQPLNINRENDISHSNSVTDYVKNLINLQKDS